MKSPNNKGFTLIELIMVMVILGILAAVATPKFFDFTGTAHEKNKDAIIGRVRAGLNNFAADKLVEVGTRSFPTAGTLTFVKIFHETPINWTIVNGASADTLVYAGDNSKFEYSTLADSSNYTITAL